MSNGVEIKVRGDKRLAATLRAAARDLDDMASANAKVASTVAQAARGRAPRRTGALARSTTGRADSGNVARISASVVYAGVIHNGWPRHNIERQPYIADTIAAQEAQIVGQYKTEVDKTLSRVKGA